MLRIIDEINPDAIVIGNGIGKERKTMEFIKEVLESIDMPTVIDADAIFTFSKEKIEIKNNFLFTPHSKEFYYLTGIYLSNELKERVIAVESIAKNLKCTILLKGHIDIISDGSKTLLNKTGTPSMTVGGTGDVLAGLVGGLLAMKNDLATAGAIAAYINGKAGELAEKKYGIGIIPSDIIKEIPKVIKSVS